jgi:ABC-2 type transport system permease protein
MTGSPSANPASFHPEHFLGYYVWKLLRLQAGISLSAFRAARTRRKVGTIILAVIILIFAVVVFVVSWLLLGFLRSPELAKILAEQNQPSVTPFLEAVPVMILAGSFIAILVTSFGVLLQALYLSGDMDFLLSAPIPIRAVFVAKMLQAILPNFGFIALFSLPVLFGLGAAGNYSLLYYPLVVVVLALLALASAGISSLLVMGVVRIFPARRVAEVLGFLGATISIICSQSGNLINGLHLENSNVDSSQIPLSTLTRFNSPWIPLSWPGRGLVELGEGRWLTGALFLALTLALAGALFLVSLETAQRLYYTGWASVQVGGRKKRTARPMPAVPVRKTAAPSIIAQVIPQPVLGIIRKDFLTLRRDLRNMSQLIMPIIFGAIYGLLILRSGGEPPAGQGEAPAWLMQAFKTVLLYGNVAISLFVVWSLLSRLGLMGFSQEGKNYWMLKTAPVGAGRLLAAKLLVAYLPALVIGCAFMLVMSLLQRAPLSIFFFGLAVVSLSTIGTAGISLTFGVTGVNLTWEDPRRMNAGFSGCLSMLASFVYQVASLALFFGPPIIFSVLGGPQLVGQAMGIVLGAAFSISCAVIPLQLVAKRVARIGEA